MHIIITDLIVSEPDFAIKNSEEKHMIHKWFTFWVVIRSREYLRLYANRVRSIYTHVDQIGRSN